MTREIAGSTLGCSGKPLLILDLDETLVHTADHDLQSPADFCLAGLHVYLRPFLTDFLMTVSQLFKLAVWSSANRPSSAIWTTPTCVMCCHSWNG